jgi:hypothetical protein
MAQRPPRSRYAVPVDNYLYVPAPQGGLDTDSPLLLLPDSFAAQLDNFIPMGDKLRLRGGMVLTEHAAGWIGAGITQFNWLASAFVSGPGNTSLMVSSRASSINVRPNLQPWVRSIAPPTPDLRAFEAIPAAASVNTPPTFGSRHSTFTSYVGAPLIPATQYANCTYWYGHYPGMLGIATAAGWTTPDSRLFVANATPAVGIGPPVLNVTVLGGVAVGPSGQYVPAAATALKIMNGRLFVLGGGNENTTTTFANTYSPNLVYFSNPLPTSGIPAAGYTTWSDPITLTQNAFSVPSDSYGSPGTGLASYNNFLLVFTTSAVWRVDGIASTTPANWSQYELTRAVGCMDSHSIVETDNGIYFADKSGIYLTTGTSIRLISGRTEQSFRHAVSRFMASELAFEGGGGIFGVRLANGHVAFTVVIVTFLAGVKVVQTIWSACYDPNTNAWYRLTTALHGGTDTDPQIQPVNGELCQLVADTNGGAVYSFGNTNNVLVEAAQWGQTIEDTAFFSQAEAGVDWDNNNALHTLYPIEGVWLTPLLPYTSAERFYGHPKTLSVDYFLRYDPTLSGPTPATGLASLINTDNPTQTETMTLPPQGIPRSSDPDIFRGPTARPEFGVNPILQHRFQDIAIQGDQGHWVLQVTLSGMNTAFVNSPTNNPQITMGEVYGAGISYAEGRQIRSTP